MRVACVESEGDPPAWLLERNILTADRPRAGERPVVEAQAIGQLVGMGFVERGAAR